MRAQDFQDEADTLDPIMAAAWRERGDSLFDAHQFVEAISAYDKALALDPDSAAAWNNRGNAQFLLRQFYDALHSYDKALVIDSEMDTAWLGWGEALTKLGRRGQACEAFSRVVRLNPGRSFAKGILLHAKMQCCDWDGTASLIQEIENDIAAGKTPIYPFGWLGVSDSPASLRRCAENYSALEHPAMPAAEHPAPSACGKIRIGYVSGEFRDHATSHLLVGVLEQHDRERFDVYAFDAGWNDGSRMRHRIERALKGNLISVAGMGDAQAAAAIRTRGIDILINLTGFFGDYSRMGVFSRRPAPVQVNYLGFPGTLGAPYMDYIVADRVVIPEDDAPFYTEKVAWLPNCYQANDDIKRIAETGTRAEHGLPDEAFVFCSFNAMFKILPDIWARWMRLLTSIPGSVLWLLHDNADAAANLRKEAAAHAVDPARLIFAPRLPLAQHLARHCLADLLLDTLPCNAHTTASDALWAGLPLLTCRGKAFSGRVAASLLNAMSLPELIAETPEQYEAMALDFARSPETLAALRDKLASNRGTQPLFDTKAFTRELEAAYAAYKAMQERRRAGLAPDHITVPRRMPSGLV